MGYDKYNIIQLDNGLEVIAKDVTTIFTKIVEDVENIVLCHKYKDLITDTYIYTRVEEGKEKEHIIGTWKAFISRKEVIAKLSTMTEDARKEYISKIFEEKNKASKRSQVQSLNCSKRCQVQDLNSSKRCK